MDEMIVVIRYTDGYRVAQVHNDRHYFIRQYIVTDASLLRIEQWATSKNTKRNMVDNGVKRQLKITTRYFGKFA